MSFYPSTFYIHVKVDIPDEYMKHVIGKNGRHFKNIALQTNVSYIWYNKKRSIVEIWGLIDNLSKAAYAVQTRLNYIKEKFLTQEQIENYSKLFNWPNDEYFEYDLNNDENLFNVNYIHFLIGKEGKNFKYITKKTEASFIWYNNIKNCIQIWSPKENLEKSIALLENHIQHINSYIELSNEFSNIESSIQEQN